MSSSLMSSSIGQNCMRWRPAASGLKFKLTRDSLQVALCVYLCTGVVGAACGRSQCPNPDETFVGQIDSPVRSGCYDNGTTVHIVCTRGFQQKGAWYTITCDGARGEWRPDGACRIDLLSLFVATLVFYMVFVFIFIALYAVVWRRKRRRDRVALNQDSPARDRETTVHYGNAVYRHYDNLGYDNESIMRPVPAPRSIASVRQSSDEHTIPSGHAARNSTRHSQSASGLVDNARENSSGALLPHSEPIYENVFRKTQPPLQGF